MGAIFDLFLKIKDYLADYTFVNGTKDKNEDGFDLTNEEKPVIFLGHSGRDFVDAGPCNDILIGGAGNDCLTGFDGDDLIYGGTGNDSLFGTDGRDKIFGGPGNDKIHSGHCVQHVFYGDRSTGSDYLNETFICTKDLFYKDENGSCQLSLEFLGQIEEQNEIMFVDLLDFNSNYIIKDVFITYDDGNELEFVHKDTIEKLDSLNHQIHFSSLQDFLNSRLVALGTANTQDGCTLKAKIAFMGGNNGEYFLTTCAPIYHHFNNWK